MNKDLKAKVNIDTSVMVSKLDVIAKHVKALSDELKLIDSQCDCGDCSVCLKINIE